MPVPIRETEYGLESVVLMFGLLVTVTHDALWRAERALVYLVWLFSVDGWSHFDWGYDCFNLPLGFWKPTATRNKQQTN